MHVHQAQHGFERRTADIVEVHVDTARTLCTEILSECVAAIVDGGVEPEPADDDFVLRVGAGDPDHPSPLKPGELPCHTPCRARRRRHHHCLARHRAADREHAEVGGETRDAQRAHVERQRSTHVDRS